MRERLRAIEDEIARRKVAQSDASLQWLLDELDAMGERLRADSDWREPTPEEQEENRRIVEAALKEMPRRRGP